MAAASMDYYRLLNITRTATPKEIKAAYFKLAKTLHPDVTGNDKKKAELFKHVTEAHAVLSDAARRREYDASQTHAHFRQQDTTGATRHPSYYPSYSTSDRRVYGINEEVWMAHHYGPGASRQSGVPPRFYGEHIAEEARIRQMRNHYKLSKSAGFFLRREARLRRRAEEDAAKERERRKREGKDKEEEDTSVETNCVIS